jgi:hypothetical protein
LVRVINGVLQVPLFAHATSHVQKSIHHTARSAKLTKMPSRTFFRGVAWLLLLAIAVFTLAPIEFRLVTGAPASLERFLAFAAIGTAYCLGYPKHRLPVLVLLVGVAGFLEIAQNIVPGRHGRFPDGMMKASGALLGAAFATLVVRHKRSP